MDRLRVATLNVWNMQGPWAARLELIRRELRELAPDLLGLQEVLRFAPDGADGADQASVIGEGLGYSIAYAPAGVYGKGLTLGNALLSRFPILEQRGLPLPGSESGETRSLLHALVDAPCGRVPVFVTHLNWKLHHGRFRARQVRFIADVIFELAPVSDAIFPPILMGDFNAEPDADEMRFLRGLATLEGKSVYFADAWVYAGQGPGYSYDRRNPYAALFHEPPRRIDYILVRGPDRRLRGEPLSARLCFAEPQPAPDGPVWPSDHFGVVTELAAAPRDA
jgi:endonuclease/exonuclease/phosphatase family metal-dependent hydrolase